MEDAHKLLKTPKIGNVQTFGFVYTDTNGLYHGLVSKTQSFHLKRICVVILWHTTTQHTTQHNNTTAQLKSNSHSHCHTTEHLNSLYVMRVNRLSTHWPRHVHPSFQDKSDSCVQSERPKWTSENCQSVKQVRRKRECCERDERKIQRRGKVEKKWEEGRDGDVRETFMWEERERDKDEKTERETDVLKKRERDMKRESVKIEKKVQDEKKEGQEKTKTAHL